MSRNVKVKVNNSALNDAILDAAKAAAKDQSFEIDCPHCGESILAPAGKSKCPHCGKLVELTLNFKFN